MNLFCRIFYWLLLVPIFVLSGTEVVLRVFDPVGIEYVFEARRYFKQMQKHPVYSYRHTPGWSGYLQGVHVRINEEGLRGAPFDINKRPDRKRILVLGDSVVFGWGVQEEDSTPSHLQREMKAGDENYPEVISAGVGSWNTRTEVEFLRERGIEYQPDIVALVVVQNDIDFKKTGRVSIDREALKEERRRKAERKAKPSSLMVKINKYYRDWSYRLYTLAAFRRILRVKEQSDRYERAYTGAGLVRVDVENAVREMKELCDRHGIILIPFIFGERSSPAGRAYTEFYSGLFKTLGVKAHYFPDDLYQSELRNSLVDPHPNSTGHALMAHAIYTELEGHL